MVTCGLCGHVFDGAALSCQAGCPLASLQGCALVCCPNCGYQMVDERRSSAARLLRRLWPAPPAKPVPTTETGQ
jgi:hypothetical protein